MSTDLTAGVIVPEIVASIKIEDIDIEMAVTASMYHIANFLPS